MTEYAFTEQELDDLKECFFTEAAEILQSLNQETLKLEAGQDRENSLKTIQRHLHTLKGNSRALGFTCLNTLTHRSEDLLKALQDAGREVDEPLIGLLFAINDTLQVCVDGYKAQGEVKLDELVIERIEEYISASGNGAGGHVVSTSGTEGAVEVYDIKIEFDPECDSKSACAQLITERLSTLGELLGAEPEPSSEAFEQADGFMVRFGSSEQPEVIKKLIDVHGVVRGLELSRHEASGVAQPKQGPRPAQTKDEAAQTLRVESQRIDKILNLVGELVIGRSMVGQVLSEMAERSKKDERVKRLGDANAFMEKTLSQLQKNVMKIRMLPISQVFRKFPRVVRDLSLEKGKQIQLVMQGEKTELDKSLLDVIGEPLIHLVRNAVDHGIELPDERERLGKPRIGTVTLTASHEGNQIIIDVTDDGAGLDLARLRKKAVEKGVKTLEEADRLTDDEALDLIFLSGFSTAEVVTDISGRGLGMDIVRTTVESLKGKIQVHSKPGEGAKFTLRLPLTLAIIRAMLFMVNERLFALPMSSIERITRVKEGELQTVTGKDVLRFRDKVISLISLKKALMMNDIAPGPETRKFVIIVGFIDKLYGFLVDRLVGQQELVIKALEDHWGTVDCTSGASILGSGKVVLILDAPALIVKEMRREAGKG